MNRLGTIISAICTLVLIISIAFAPYRTNSNGGTGQDDDDYYLIEVVCSGNNDRT